jgi:predicted membrane protein
MKRIILNKSESLILITILLIIFILTFFIPYSFLGVPIIPIFPLIFLIVLVYPFFKKQNKNSHKL